MLIFCSRGMRGKEEGEKHLIKLLKFDDKFQGYKIFTLSLPLPISTPFTILLHSSKVGWKSYDRSWERKKLEADSTIFTSLKFHFLFSGFEIELFKRSFYLHRVFPISQACVHSERKFFFLQWNCVVAIITRYNFYSQSHLCSHIPLDKNQIIDISYHSIILQSLHCFLKAFSLLSFFKKYFSAVCNFFDTWLMCIGFSSISYRLSRISLFSFYTSSYINEDHTPLLAQMS